MKRASGIGHLTPFLPGLGTLLEDPEVSEIMINGPGNVWVERGGRLDPHEAPGLTAAWLHRAAIHIARPLGLDPAARPILDARLGDSSRVAISTPPASPEVAITIRRFGGRAFSANDLVRQGALRTASGSKPAPPFPRRPSRSATWSGTRSATGPTTSLSARSGAARPPISSRRSTPATAVRSPPCMRTTRSALSRLASCAMQAGGALPWEVTCRGVVDGISLVLHMARQGGRRFVEEAIEVRGYDAATGRWITKSVWSGAEEAPESSTHTPKEVNA